MDNREDASESSLDGERDPIAVFRIDGIVEGWIPKLEGRVSDGLNQADRMRIRTAAADGTPGEWLELDLDEVVAVAPAPRPPSPYRIARRHHAVEIEAGQYRVTGTAHLPLGADPERYAASTAQTLAATYQLHGCRRRRRVGGRRGNREPRSRVAKAANLSSSAVRLAGESFRVGPSRPASSSATPAARHPERILTALLRPRPRRPRRSDAHIQLSAALPSGVRALTRHSPDGRQQPPAQGGAR